MLIDLYASPKAATKKGTIPKSMRKALYFDVQVIEKREAMKEYDKTLKRELGEMRQPKPKKQKTSSS